MLCGKTIRLGLLGLVLVACGENANGQASTGGTAATPGGSTGADAGGGSGRETHVGGNKTSGGADSGGSGSGGSSAGGAVSGGKGNADGGTAEAESGGVTSTGGGETGGASTGGTSNGGTGGDADKMVSVLVFSKTVELRHESIEAGVKALSTLATERGWSLFATEDPKVLTGNQLRGRDVVVFLNTSGDVLNDDQQAALEHFMSLDNGFVGIHAASDTEYGWEWYGGLVGAYFREHADVQTADVVVTDASHASTQGLPNPWRRTDEWYAFRMNPRAQVNVLLALDETSYEPGSSHMDGDHPIAWYHEYHGARAFYTALGHTEESYSDAQFLAHIAGGIEWAAGK